MCIHPLTTDTDFRAWLRWILLKCYVIIQITKCLLLNFCRNICDISVNSRSIQHAVLSLTMDPLAAGALSLIVLGPSLGGLWGMLSIQAQIRASAQEAHRHRQTSHKLLDISTQPKSKRPQEKREDKEQGDRAVQMTQGKRKGSTAVHKNKRI